MSDLMKSQRETQTCLVQIAQQNMHIARLQTILANVQERDAKAEIARLDAAIKASDEAVKA